MLQNDITTEEVYEADFILPLLNQDSRFPEHVIFDDRLVRINTDKLACFKRNGLKCANCGIKGSEFHLQKNSNSDHFLNLYAKKKNGNLELMTMDHIVPRSKNGSRRARNNLQTMCYCCNQNKADNFDTNFNWVGSLDDVH
jgi:5-methylcytosine-specific restriction endonuclease McrA